MKFYSGFKTHPHPSKEGINTENHALPTKKNTTQAYGKE